MVSDPALVELIVNQYTWVIGQGKDSTLRLISRRSPGTLSRTCTDLVLASNGRRL